MLIFISWSGNRSKAVAEALRDWLPSVIPSLQPWMSSVDISKGKRWHPEIAGQLEKAHAGIVCLTKENVNKPWILFEAGALAKTIEDTYVCTYLLDLEPTELKDPLAQFQATIADEKNTLNLLHALNKALGDEALTEQEVDEAFRKCWPELEETLSNIPEDRFRAIFGQDAFLGERFHLIHTSFSPKIRLMDAKRRIFDLVDRNGRPLRPVYCKVGSGGTPNAKAATFTLENPVSAAGARALRYIAPFIQAQSRGLVSISSDYERKTDIDISFISFGGPLANYKTEQTLSDENNNLVKFVEGGDPYCKNSSYGFFDATTGKKIVGRKPGFDYGLILKLNPKPRPERTWIVCAGYREWGTSGAAWYLARHWESIYQHAKGKPFAVIVAVEVKKGDESAYAIWPPEYTNEKASK